MNAEVYIWTEALGCAPILRPMLLSYVEHHNEKIHVFVYEEDCKYLPSHPLICPVPVSMSSESVISRNYLEEGFKRGHLGTARLWARIIKKTEAKNFIHLDSDTIFVGNVTQSLKEKIASHGVVGSRRPYRFTSSRVGFRKLQLRFRADAVNTHCFAFKNEFDSIEERRLEVMILGQKQELLAKIFYPTIDFFDKLTFYLRSRSGIYYLDSENQHRSGTYSRNGEFESKMISFSAVGSGYSFYYGKSISPSKSYEDFAVASYALYSKYLLEQEIETELLDSGFLLEKLKRLDKETWTFSNKG